MYSGLKLPLVLGEDGLYDIRRSPENGLIEALGITLENNQLEKEGGALKKTSASLPGAVLALLDWWPTSTTQRTIAVTHTGGVFLDDGNSWTFPTTLLPVGTFSFPSAPPYLAVGGAETPSAPRKLFLFSGVGPIYVGSGDFVSLSQIPTTKTPAEWAGGTWPTCGVVHAGRMWAFLRHTAYYSTLADHTDFTGTGSGSMPIDPGFGDGIVACAVFRRMLVLFKYPRGVYVITASDPNTANWTYQVQSWAVGATGPWAVCSVTNDLLFMNQEGNVHLLSATAVDRDPSASDISTPKLGTWIRDHLDAASLAFCHAIWYPAKAQVHIAARGPGYVYGTQAGFDPGSFDPGSFSTTTQAVPAVPIYRLMVDFHNQSLGPRYTYSTRDVVTALMIKRAGGVDKPHAGTDAGLVYELDRPERTKDGAGYPATAQTQHSDLGDLMPMWRGRKKIFDFLELWLEGTGNYTLSVDCWVDGRKKNVGPITFNLIGTGNILGVTGGGADFKLDDPVLGVLGDVSTFAVRRKLFWTGTRISFVFKNATAGQTFKVVRGHLGVRLAE